jgi:hypothetical protein
MPKLSPDNSKILESKLKQIKEDFTRMKVENLKRLENRI